MGSSQDSLLTRHRFTSFLVICFMILLNGASEGLAQERLRDSRTLAHWLGYQQVVFEDDSLNTERPTFTPNSTSLGRKVFQVETGYLYTRQAAAGSPSVVSHQLPETQLRWGLFADWFEFRISQAFLSQAFLSQEEPSTRLTGASDTQIGCLIALTKQQEYLPECAWIPFVSVPSGSSWASDGATRGGAVLSYSWGFGENWTLGASTQLSIATKNQPFSQGGWSGCGFLIATCGLAD